MTFTGNTISVTGKGLALKMRLSTMAIIVAMFTVIFYKSQFIQ